MKARLIRISGTDEDVAKAAWVNHDRRSTGDETEVLIKKMATSRPQHKSPFFHCFATMEIYAPMPVWHQLDRHRVGFGVNEHSRRYQTGITEVYKPDWRHKTNSRATASHGERFTGSVRKDFNFEFQQHVTGCLRLYMRMVRAGVAPEQARFILPYGVYTKIVWSGTLYAWASMCHIRQHDDVQGETRQLVEQIDAQLRRVWPISFKYLVPNGGGYAQD